MENLSNVSSEEELLQLRNEGKISEDEYEELRSAMRKSAKPEVEPPLAPTNKAKLKHKLAKVALWPQRRWHLQTPALPLILGSFWGLLLRYRPL